MSREDETQTDHWPEVEVLTSIIENMVDRPEKVEINRTTDEMGILLQLRVAQEDTGRVIGKDGKTIQSIRSVLKAVGMRHNSRVQLKVLEPIIEPTHDA